jgi:hypothetical protein
VIVALIGQPLTWLRHLRLIIAGGRLLDAGLRFMPRRFACLRLRRSARSSLGRPADCKERE